MAPISNTFKCTLTEFSSLFACVKFLAGTYFTALALVGQIFKSSTESQSFPALPAVKLQLFCPWGLPKSSLSFHLFCFACYPEAPLEALEAESYTVHCIIQTPVTVWHVMLALHPSHGPSAISMANRPAQIWPCHWELQVPLESIWSVCGYVLFDIMTNPSCTSGCRIAQRKDSFLLGRLVVTFLHFSPYFSHIKRNKIVWRSALPTCIRTTGLRIIVLNLYLILEFAISISDKRWASQPFPSTVVHLRKDAFQFTNFALPVCLYPPSNIQGWTQGDSGIVKAFVL